MSRPIDLTGDAYNYLRVLGEVSNEDYASENKVWICLCKCGELTIADQGSLRNGPEQFLIDAHGTSRRRL